MAANFTDFSTGQLSRIMNDPSVVAAMVEAFKGSSVGGVSAADERGKQAAASVSASVIDASQETKSDDSDVSSSSGSVEMPSSVYVRRDLSELNFCVEPEEDVSFFKSCVYTPNVRALEKRLRKLGIKKFGGRLQDLALVTYAAGVMPSSFTDGKKRLKAFSMLGDALAKYLIVLNLMNEGKNVEEISDVTTSALTRKALTEVCVKSGYAQHLVLPTGVNVKTAAVAGEHFEALVGVIAKVHNVSAATLLLQDVGLLSS